MANQTREKLLDVAYEEIYEYGYNGVSVDKILKKANLNKGSMYHFFKSKKELGLAVINERVKTYINDKYSPLLEYKENIIEEILILLNKRETFNFNRGCILNNLVQELSTQDKDFQKALEGIYFHFEQIMKDTLDNAIKIGEIEHNDTKNLAVYIVASIEGCQGTAKKSQNGQMFYDCTSQLRHYLSLLKK